MKHFLSMFIAWVVVVSCVGCATNSKVQTDKIIVDLSQMPCIEFCAAEAARDVNAMKKSADSIAATSPAEAEKYYERVALFAALQQDKSLFDEIVLKSPSGKKFEKYLLEGSDSKSQLPKLVSVSSLDEVKSLPKGTQPVWKQFFAECYVKLSADEALYVAENVNRGRRIFDTDSFMKAIEKLSSYQCKENILACFSIKQLVEECFVIADVTGNGKIASELCEYITIANGFSKNEIQEYKAEAKSLSATRGGYVSYKTSANVKTRTITKNGKSVTYLTLSQSGESIELRIDGSTSQKAELLEEVVNSRKGRPLRALVWKCINGRTGDNGYLDYEKCYILTLAVEKVAEVYDMSFPEALVKAIELAE